MFSASATAGFRETRQRTFEIVSVGVGRQKAKLIPFLLAIKAFHAMNTFDVLPVEFWLSRGTGENLAMTIGVVQVVRANGELASPESNEPAATRKEYARGAHDAFQRDAANLGGFDTVLASPRVVSAESTNGEVLQFLSRVSREWASEVGAKSWGDGKEVMDP